MVGNGNRDGMKSVWSTNSPKLHMQFSAEVSFIKFIDVKVMCIFNVFNDFQF